MAGDRQQIPYTFDGITGPTFTPSVSDSWDTINTDAGTSGSTFGAAIQSYLNTADNMIPDFREGDSANISRVLNLMSGAKITGTSADDIENDFIQNITTVDTGRTQRFYSFWNNVSNPSELGVGFSTFDSASDENANFQNFVARNIFLTYILILVFEKMVSSSDSIQMGGPLNIFTEKVNPFFCNASENLRIFMASCSGIGNFPIFTGSNTTIKGTDTLSYLNEYINKGYLKNFCNNEFEKHCPNVKNPKDNQKCITDYRTKISQTSMALSWCGCFTPLPSWALKIYTEKDPDAAPNTVTNKDFPNACDNLCFGPPGKTIIKIYEAPFISASGNVQDNPNTPVPCKSTICVIDENAINAVNSSGNITFNQICPKQPGSITKCFLDVSNPNILDNVKSGSNGMLSQALFRQDCPDAVCYTVNDQTGAQEISKCNVINTPSTGGLFGKAVEGLSGTKKYEKIYSSFWDGVLIIIFLLILFEFAYVEVHRYMQRSKLL